VAVRLALVAAYLATRLTGLTVLPIFLDETTHIRAAVAIADGEHLFRQWNYGKGLSIFVNALLFPWAFDHYLGASRALVVAFGLVTLLATMALARRLFGETAGIVAGILYVLCPFTFLYDRLALTDPPMATFATLALLLAVRITERPTVPITLLLGLCLVLAVLTKATALLLLPLPLGVVLLLAPRSGRAWAAALLSVLLASAACYLPLWVFFHTTSTVRLGLEYQESDLGSRLVANVPLAASWLGTYLTAPLAVFAGAGLAIGLRDRSRAALLLGLVVVLPVLAFASVSTLWFPRYVVFVAPPALVLAAHGFARLTEAWPRRAGLALLAAAALPALHLDYHIATDPPHAEIPTLDLVQYVYGWPSGYATDETLAFVKRELLAHPEGLQVIVHSPSLRTTSRALGLEFAHEPRVALKDLDLGSAPGLRLLAVWGTARPTLLVVSPVGPSREPPDSAAWAHLGGRVQRACKPDGSLCDEVYRLCHGALCPHLAPLLN
jgi:4-amino-4-deoxy-L-arabinose transferase-like glycosyltransferase